jgi:serine/threonine-protein kinase
VPEGVRAECLSSKDWVKKAKLVGDAMTDDQVGNRLGKYQIQTEIGKGGMGQVFLGYDAMLERQVAIKVLAPHLVWETGFVERFLREARAAARLKHSSIVTIYDVGQEGNKYYIVMEYLEGPTLARLIAQRGPQSSKIALPILGQLAGALDYAHGCGLVHRDVKPGNVIVSPSGHVTLTDFGVARAAQESRLTSTGALVGTPQYMSPEHAQGEEVDHRSDIYSLGVVAYEMLTGRTPFGATTPHAVLHQLIYDPPPPIYSLRPDLPPALEQVMATVLAKEPANRYQTAGDFVKALGQTTRMQSVPGRAPSEPSTTGQAPAAGQSPQMVATVMVEGQPPFEAQAAAPREAAGFRVSAPHEDASLELSPPEDLARPKMRNWTLWFFWFAATALGWALGWTLGRAIQEPIHRLFGPEFGFIMAETSTGAATWSLTGLLIGTGQWLAIRSRIRRAGWWVLATVVGWTLVGSLQWFRAKTMESIMIELVPLIGSFSWQLVPWFDMSMGMLSEGLVGLVLGVVQWTVLRKKIRGAGWWIVISMLAWASNAILVAVLGRTLHIPNDERIWWLVSLMGGIVLGLVTATGMVWLVSRRGRNGMVRS